MKAVILAGGLGTRLAEETSVRPKPMVEVGGYPLLWHIMKNYSLHGVDDFIICLGYKSEYIKKFFIDYNHIKSDFTIDLKKQKIDIHKQRAENWKVTLLDTGLATMTGGRIKQAIEHMASPEPFCLTYGDGVSDVNITDLIKFHHSHGKLATVTAVTPPGRFGILDIKNDTDVTGFREKIISDQYRVNGGFFILDPKVTNLIPDDLTVWEQGPLNQLATQNELRAWNHDGFWYPVDTLRDKHYLDRYLTENKMPWL